jgi:hypothetical protein
VAAWNVDLELMIVAARQVLLALVAAVVYLHEQRVRRYGEYLHKERLSRCGDIFAQREIE